MRAAPGSGPPVSLFVRPMPSKPISVKVVAIILALFAAFFVVTSALAAAYVPMVVSCVGLVGAVGLLSTNPRSRFLVYGASAFVAISWVVPVAQLALSGWPVADLTQSAITLVPGFLLLAICVGCSLLSARY